MEPTSTDTTHDERDDVPHDLTDAEVRVLGCLVEKEATVPDSYPLTVNSLRNACNQSTSRDPVVSYDDHTVEQALASLRARGLTRTVHSTSNRATKYRHVLPDELGLEPDEVATYERRLALRLQDLPGGGIRDNTMIDVEDFSQGDLKCQILVVHCGDLDEEAHPEGFALAGKLEAGAGKENEKRLAKGAAEEAGPLKKAKVAEESDSDECLIVG